MNELVAREKIAGQLITGLMQAGAKRDRAREIAYLCLHAVDQAMATVDRICSTLPDRADVLSAQAITWQILEQMAQTEFELVSSAIAQMPGFNEVQMEINGGAA